MQEIFAAIGEKGFERLVAAFYRRVPHDDITFEPAVSEKDLPGAGQRLRDFLIFRFGGPPRYIERRGHPRLRMRHAPFAVDRAARDHWLQAMEAAMEESMLPEEVKSVLSAYFESTAAAMMNTE